MLEIPEKLLETLKVLKPFKRMRIKQNTIGLIQKNVMTIFFFNMTICMTIRFLILKCMKR